MNLRTLLFVCLLLPLLRLNADVAIENYGGTIIEERPAHGLVINTFEDRALVFNADTQQMLGMLSLGYGHNAVEIDRARGTFYVAETYLSRHNRGERTDVITTYDFDNLAATSEIVIPAKRASGSPMRHNIGLLTDESGARLMLVINITPAVTVSVANLESGEFLGEISTAGCGLVYPVEGLSFLQICGDGTMQLVNLNSDGSEASRTRSESFFDLQTDPLMEKSVRTPDGWLFNTFAGKVFHISVDAGAVKVAHRFDLSEDPEAWRIGGMQPLAYHADSNLLLALMHEGGEDTHKDPGTHIWYFNAETGLKTHELELANPTFSIQVSQDDAPLIYGGAPLSGEVNLYDLKRAELTGTIKDVGFPTILQNL